jgi:serine/threonine protein kinase
VCDVDVAFLWGLSLLRCPCRPLLASPPLPLPPTPLFPAPDSRAPPIAHRDLKSANLLVDSQWHVKVADFSLSRALEMGATAMTVRSGQPHPGRPGLPLPCSSAVLGQLLLLRSGCCWRGLCP